MKVPIINFAFFSLLSVPICNSKPQWPFISVIHPMLLNFPCPEGEFSVNGICKTAENAPRASKTPLQSDKLNTTPKQYSRSTYADLYTRYGSSSQPPSHIPKCPNGEKRVKGVCKKVEEVPLAFKISPQTDSAKVALGDLAYGIVPPQYVSSIKPPFYSYKCPEGKQLVNGICKKVEDTLFNFKAQSQNFNANATFKHYSVSTFGDTYQFLSSIKPPSRKSICPKGEKLVNGVCKKAENATASSKSQPQRYYVKQKRS